MNTTGKSHFQTSKAMYIKVFSQYFLIIFMIFLVIAASGIVIWTAFYQPGAETSAQSEMDVDIVSLIQTRDDLTGWLRAFPEDGVGLPVNQPLSADYLPENIPLSDLQKIDGIQWIADGDRIGLKNLPGDDIQIFVWGFDEKEFHLYDDWMIWCPVRELNCYFQLVEPENLIDFTTIKINSSE